MMNDLLAEARTLYRAGAYAEATELLHQAVSRQPGFAAAQSVLGLCRLRLGDSQAALALLSRAAELTPDDGDVLLNYGIGLAATGDPGRAAPLFRAAAERLPYDPAPQLNLATALLSLRDLRGASAAARKARLRAPEMAEVHYILGLIHLGQDELIAAGKDFLRATQLAPGFAEAWVNLGVTRYRVSNMFGARAAIEQALAVQPDHATANVNLAVFDCISGHSDAAEARLDAVLARDPDNAEALLNRAIMLLGKEDGAGGALALLDRTLPSDRQAAQHWRLQQTLALLHLNRLEEARHMLDSVGVVPPPLLPLLEFRRAALALAEGDKAAALPHATSMEQALRNTPGILPEHRLISWYHLARFWLRMGDPHRAFDAWTEGHRELARFQPFSRDTYDAYQRATVAAFDRARLHHGPRAGNRDPAPVFIVGMPRSGTTLTEHILAAHADVFGAGERNALPEAYAALGGGWESPAGTAYVAGLDQNALDQAAERYLAGLHALAPGAARITDKMPPNFRLLGFAALLLPGAKVISCERDPRDIGASIYQFRFFGYHPYAHDLGDLGWYIARQRQLMQHWLDVLPLPILRLPLTDWIDDFDGTLRRVLAFLDLPYDPACERFYEQDREVKTVSRYQVRMPVNAQGIGRWRRFAGQLGPLIAQLEAAGVPLDSTGGPTPASETVDQEI